MNWIWPALIVGSVVAAGFSGRMAEVTAASIDSAKAAVTLAIGLIGVMAFWLGMMRIVQAGGFLHTLARWLRPLMVRLFPEVPADHPAMSAMIMNMASNMLGLGNAATPFGIKAMQELEELKPACVDTGMSYEERVARREEEIEALKEALCILDKEGPVQTEGC